MRDIPDIYKCLQQQFHRDDLLLSDLLTCTESAVHKLRLMTLEAYPTKRESQANFDVSSETGK